MERKGRLLLASPLAAAKHTVTGEGGGAGGSGGGRLSGGEAFMIDGWMGLGCSKAACRLPSSQLGPEPAAATASHGPAETWMVFTRRSPGLPQPAFRLTNARFSAGPWLMAFGSQGSQQSGGLEKLGWWTPPSPARAPLPEPPSAQVCPWSRSPSWCPRTFPVLSLDEASKTARPHQLVQ